MKLLSVLLVTLSLAAITGCDLVRNFDGPATAAAATKVVPPTPPAMNGTEIKSLTVLTATTALQDAISGPNGINAVVDAKIAALDAKVNAVVDSKIATLDSKLTARVDVIDNRLTEAEKQVAEALNTSSIAVARTTALEAKLFGNGNKKGKGADIGQVNKLWRYGRRQNEGLTALDKRVASLSSASTANLIRMESATQELRRAIVATGDTIPGLRDTDRLAIHELAGESVTQEDWEGASANVWADDYTEAVAQKAFPIPHNGGVAEPPPVRRNRPQYAGPRRR